jgi:predicted RNase H-like HicB family nuclease
MKIRVIIEEDKHQGGYSASCPELNNVSSCGETVDEALENLKEAIDLLIEPIPERYLRKTGNRIEFRELAV